MVDAEYFEITVIAFNTIADIFAEKFDPGDEILVGDLVNVLRVIANEITADVVIAEALDSLDSF